MRRIKKIAKNIYLNPKPSWMNQQMVLIILVLLVLLTALAWSEPQPNKQFPEGQLLQSAENTPTIPEIISATPTPTSLPDEWIQNSENTNDIVLVGVLLVLIVVGGTYNAIRQSKKSQKETDQ